MKKIGIHQPNFMPWLGYFYKIFQSDIFVILDDVQFQKTGASYSSRVSILQNGKAQYLTIPIKRKEGVWNINETEFSLPKWRIKVINTLQACYGKAPFFKENKEFIFDLINFETNNLSEFNSNFIINVSEKLGYAGSFEYSSNVKTSEVSTGRLIELIQYFDGNIYLSGQGGEKYQEEKMFELANIDLKYIDYPRFQYSQFKSEEFVAGLSILDALFNIGFDGIKKMLTLKSNL